jgi:hypothetical protein
MAVPTQSPPPPSYDEQHLARMEAEHRMLADEKFTGWAVIWTLFAFKIATLGIIVYMARNTSHAGSSEQMAYIVATTWYWFFIPLIAFSGLIGWRLRLRKARKRAEQLKQSEFSVPEPTPLTEDEMERLRRLPLPAETDR